MDYSPLGSSVHGILQARVLEWFAISSSRGSSQPRDQTHVFCVFCIFRQVLYHWATWEAHNLVRPQQIFKFIILQDWEQKPFILIFWGSGYECTFLKLEIFYCKIIQIDLKRTDSHRSCFRLYWLQPHMSEDRYRWTFFHVIWGLSHSQVTALEPLAVLVAEPASLFIDNKSVWSKTAEFPLQRKD